MKLRTKLLLGVGILLFAMVVVMYSLPAYLVQKDVDTTASSIHELLIEDHRQLVRNQQLWLRDTVGRSAQNIDSILFMIYEEPGFASTLLFNEENPLINVWRGIGRIAGYDPDIGFVQAHSPKTNQTALISPHTAEFYPIAHISEEGELVIFTVHDPDPSTVEDKVYVGMPLPEKLQSEEGYTLYALMDADKVSEQEEAIEEKIKKFSDADLKVYADRANQLVFTQVEVNAPAYYWAIKMNLIRLLAPLVVEGLILEDPGQTFLPKGIARLDTSGHGVALLTQDVIHLTPLFDDQANFESHPPEAGTPPLSAGSILVTQKEGNHAFLANTLRIQDTFISIGIPFSHSIKQLALSSNKTILLQVRNDFWIGFDDDGNKLSSSRINEIVQIGALNQKRGVVTIGGKTYFFDRISSIDNGNLLFYELDPSGGEQSIINTLLTLEKNLSKRISLQMALISIGTMLLVLLFIGRMVLGIITPITKLAQATERVVAGEYAEVALPNVGKRKDEVATLTRAFGSMVEGLQEREKIRGVLNKVVSKDVAEEILRTQVHLGGEDRVVTMLFSDIRGFSQLTENVTPQSTIQMLNSCMTKISRVIEGEGGVIDKYVGDEVMAIFGAPAPHADHALRAVSSGMLIIETLKRWNEERAQEGETLFEMGIGIHTGIVVAGNMGAEDRLNYTVLGANVNLAARLCSAAKSNQLLISEATLAEPNIRESFYVNPLEPISLKGFSEPVMVYEVTGFKWEESE